MVIVEAEEVVQALHSTSSNTGRSNGSSYISSSSGDSSSISNSNITSSTYLDSMPNWGPHGFGLGFVLLKWATFAE